MRTISQREMRNQSGALLRAVAQGESVIVTKRGVPTAVISPYKKEQHPIERLRENGCTTAPKRSLAEIADIIPNDSQMTSHDIIADIRGKW